MPNRHNDVYMCESCLCGLYLSVFTLHCVKFQGEMSNRGSDDEEMSSPKKKRNVIESDDDSDVGNKKKKRRVSASDEEEEEDDDDVCSVFQLTDS